MSLPTVEIFGVLEQFLNFFQVLFDCQEELARFILFTFSLETFCF